MSQVYASHIKSPAVLAVLGFLIITSILYSDFGRDFHGVYNAFVAAPLSYLGRAAGDSTASTGANWHVHPWWQYFRWLYDGNPNTDPNAKVISRVEEITEELKSVASGSGSNRGTGGIKHPGTASRLQPQPAFSKSFTIPEDD